MAETALANKPSQSLSPIEAIRTSLESMSDRLQAVLPSHVKPDKFIRVALVAIQTNPYLLECDRNSLYTACMKAATDGLIPDGREAALVPYKGKIQYQPMILGLCKKARNSGEIKSMDAQEVHEKDEYQSWTDENGPHFKHTKARGDRGQLVLVYAYAITHTQGTYFEEITAEEIAAIKKTVMDSKAAAFSPWGGPFEGEMRRKTAMRRLLKYRVPSSSDLMEEEEEDFRLTAASAQEDKPAEPVTTSSRLQQVVEKQAPVVHVVQPAPQLREEDLPL